LKSSTQHSPDRSTGSVLSSAPLFPLNHMILCLLTPLCSLPPSSIPTPSTHQGYLHQVSPATLASTAPLSVYAGWDNHQPIPAAIPPPMATYGPRMTTWDMAGESHRSVMDGFQSGGHASGWQSQNASLASLPGPGPTISTHWSQQGILGDARTLAPYSLPQNAGGASLHYPFNMFAEGSLSTSGTNATNNFFRLRR